MFPRGPTKERVADHRTRITNKTNPTKECMTLENCAICQQALLPVSTPATQTDSALAGCGIHCFHTVCLRQHIASSANASCPTCKMPSDTCIVYFTKFESRRMWNEDQQRPICGPACTIRHETSQEFDVCEHRITQCKHCAEIATVLALRTHACNPMIGAHQCQNGCDVNLATDPDHLLSCPRRTVVCKVCKEPVPFSQMAAHLQGHKTSYPCVFCKHIASKIPAFSADAHTVRMCRIFNLLTTAVNLPSDELKTIVGEAADKFRAHKLYREQ